MGKELLSKVLQVFVEVFLNYIIDEISEIKSKSKNHDCLLCKSLILNDKIQIQLTSNKY